MSHASGALKPQQGITRIKLQRKYDNSIVTRRAICNARELACQTWRRRHVRRCVIRRVSFYRMQAESSWSWLNGNADSRVLFLPAGDSVAQPANDVSFSSVGRGVLTCAHKLLLHTSHTGCLMFSTSTNIHTQDPTQRPVEAPIHPRMSHSYHLQYAICSSYHQFYTKCAGHVSRGIDAESAH
jgi:hypothetical protein